MDITCQGFQKIIGLARAKVPCAQNVLYPAGDLRKQAQHTN